MPYTIIAQYCLPNIKRRCLGILIGDVFAFNDLLNQLYYKTRFLLEVTQPSGHTSVAQTSLGHVFKTSKTLTQKTSIRLTIRRVGD